MFFFHSVLAENADVINVKRPRDGHDRWVAFMPGPILKNLFRGISSFKMTQAGKTNSGFRKKEKTEAETNLLDQIKLLIPVALKRSLFMAEKLTNLFSSSTITWLFSNMNIDKQ